jgi:phage-related minor tail protein
VILGEVQNTKYNEAVKALEEINELYASLSADYKKLKKNEEDLKAKTASVIEEKEALLKESEKKSSQQKVKIMLLKEALTKRNEELNITKKQVKEMVSGGVIGRRRHWKSMRRVQ